MPISNIIALAGELGVIIGAVIPITVWIRRVSDGVKCQLRSEMLRTYYHNREIGTIRQYEYENFVALYEAYKSLRGNSFIDKIYSEIKTWKVIT